MSECNSDSEEDDGSRSRSIPCFSVGRSCPFNGHPLFLNVVKHIPGNSKAQYRLTRIYTAFEERKQRLKNTEATVKRMEDAIEEESESKFYCYDCGFEKLCVKIGKKGKKKMKEDMFKIKDLYKKKCNELEDSKKQASSYKRKLQEQDFQIVGLKAQLQLAQKIVAEQPMLAEAEKPALPMLSKSLNVLKKATIQKSPPSRPSSAKSHTDTFSSRTRLPPTTSQDSFIPCTSLSSSTGNDDHHSV